MTRVRVGLALTLIGAILFAWGTLSPPIMTCTSYIGHDYRQCTQSIFQEAAVLGGGLLLLIGLVTLLSAVVRRYRSN